MNIQRNCIVIVLAGVLFGGCASREAASESSISNTQVRIANNTGVDAGFAQEIQDELLVGRGIASRLLGTFGYYDKRPSLERYVNLVGLSVAAVSGRPELNYRFAILDSSEINAFATPGGFVFVTRGLVRQIRGEDELACVLAHEIAHINLMHMYKQIKIKREMGAGEMIARALSRGGADIGGALSDLVSKGMKMLVEDGLGREKEFEADATGIAYASAAGYDPGALSRLVARLEQGKGGIKVAKTHPIGKDRIEALQVAMDANGLAAKSDKKADVLAQRFALAMGIKQK